MQPLLVEVDNESELQLCTRKSSFDSDKQQRRENLASLGNKGFEGKKQMPLQNYTKLVEGKQ